MEAGVDLYADLEDPFFPVQADEIDNSTPEESDGALVHSAELKELKRHNSMLASQNSALKKNISCLYKTARSEVGSKDAVIAELTKRVELLQGLLNHMAKAKMAAVSQGQTLAPPFPNATHHHPNSRGEQAALLADIAHPPRDVMAADDHPQRKRVEHASGRVSCDQRARGDAERTDSSVPPPVKASARPKRANHKESRREGGRTNGYRVTGADSGPNTASNGHSRGRLHEDRVGEKETDYGLVRCRRTARQPHRGRSDQKEKENEADPCGRLGGRNGGGGRQVHGDPCLHLDQSPHSKEERESKTQARIDDQRASVLPIRSPRHLHKSISVKILKGRDAWMGKEGERQARDVHSRRDARRRRHSPSLSIDRHPPSLKQSQAEQYSDERRRKRRRVVEEEETNEAIHQMPQPVGESDLDAQSSSRVKIGAVLAIDEDFDPSCWLSAEPTHTLSPTHSSSSAHPESPTHHDTPTILNAEDHVQYSASTGASTSERVESPSQSQSQSQTSSAATDAEFALEQTPCEKGEILPADTLCGQTGEESCLLPSSCGHESDKGELLPVVSLCGQTGEMKCLSSSHGHGRNDGGEVAGNETTLRDWAEGESPQSPDCQENTPVFYCTTPGNYSDSESEMTSSSHDPVDLAWCRQLDSRSPSRSECSSDVRPLSCPPTPSPDGMEEEEEEDFARQIEDFQASACLVDFELYPESPLSLVVENDGTVKDRVVSPTNLDLEDGEILTESESEAEEESVITDAKSVKLSSESSGGGNERSAKCINAENSPLDYTQRRRTSRQHTHAMTRDNLRDTTSHTVQGSRSRSDVRPGERESSWSLPLARVKSSHKCGQPGSKVANRDSSLDRRKTTPPLRELRQRRSQRPPVRESRSSSRDRIRPIRSSDCDLRARLGSRPRLSDELGAQPVAASLRRSVHVPLPRPREHAQLYPSAKLHKRH